jgi:hypothetical protein
MSDITRFTDDDQKAVMGLYRRCFGADAAEAHSLRWDWQYRRNPGGQATGPLVWVAREGPTVIGYLAALPVRLSVRGVEVQAAWGVDVCVVPERQRQGLGAVLCQVWDHNVGAALGLGFSTPSLGLLRTLRWPNVGPVPLLVKPLTRRATCRPDWPLWVNRLVSAVTLPVIEVIARARRPVGAEVAPLRRFGDEFNGFWDRLAPRFDFIVRRDATYLNWKYVDPPHVRYCCAVLRRGDEVQGYVVYRHVHEPRGRATLLVDFLTDPDDAEGFGTILRWVDREAREADSDKVRVLCQHHGFRQFLRRSGYFQVKSGVEFMAKVNAMELRPDYYGQRDGWHVTLGDSDQDR